MNEDLKELIREMQSEGKSYREIADELGISKGQAWKILNKDKEKEDEKKDSDKEKEKEKIREERDKGKLELMKRASKVFNGILDCYLQYWHIVDLSKLINAYYCYIEGKPKIIIDLWIAMEDVFYRDLYQFLRNNVDELLDMGENNYFYLSEAFAKCVDMEYFERMKKIDWQKWQMEKAERENIERKLRKREKDREETELIKGMFDIYKMFLERQNKDVLFLKETLETETINGNDNDTISNTGENNTKEGD